MIEKNALFYMANIYPEIGRMYSYLDQGKMEASKNAQKRTLDIVENIVNDKSIKPAGREEWNVIKNLVSAYDTLDQIERIILEKYAAPFSYKFMANYTG
jgi:predicted metalloendopeptidase